jgi:ribosomal protein L32
MSLETDTIPIRVCPSCGSEFQPHVTECLDCGTATVAAWEGMTQGIVARDEDLESAEPFAVDGNTHGFDVLLRSGDMTWLRPLVVRLNGSGIESRITSHPDPRRASELLLVVHPRDEERARQIELKTYVRQVPDLPGSLNRASTDVCPACGAGVRPRETECPDCGLAIWEDQDGAGQVPDEAEAGEEEGSLVPSQVSLRPPREG